MPVSSRISRNASRKFSSRNSTAETLTAIVDSGQTCLGPRPGLKAGFAQHPASDRAYEPALFRDVDELRRRHQPARRMGPADQRFGAGDRSGPEVDLGLIVQSELAPLQGAPQALLDRLPLDGPHVHLRLEELVALAAVLLGLVHGCVGVLDQGLDVEPVVGEDAHADAGGDVKLVLVDGAARPPPPAFSSPRWRRLPRRPPPRAGRRTRRRPGG